jgi:hypothetical protein
MEYAKTIIKSAMSAVINAVIIALLFFLWNDLAYRHDRLTGYWEIDAEVTKTDYAAFQGLQTHYDMLINQEGAHISGSGEKIHEKSINGGFVEYKPAARVHVMITGAITYKFFSNNLVDIHYIEKGEVRDSSTVMKLYVKSDKKMEGTFVSTSGSRGTVVWKKISGT